MNVFCNCYRTLDIINDVLSCFIGCLIISKVNLFRFKAVVKAFHDRIVPQAGYALPAVSFATHAANDVMLFEQRLEVITAILATTIRVVDESLVRFFPSNSHQQGIHNQLAHHGCIHAPANKVNAEGRGYAWGMIRREYKSMTVAR